MSLSIEELQIRVSVYSEHGSERKAAAALGIAQSTLHESLKRAAELGLIGTKPVLPGYTIKSVATKEGGAWIKQAKEPGEKFVVPDGHVVKGVSALTDADGRVIQSWQKTSVDSAQREAAIQAAIQGFKDDLPEYVPASRPTAVLPGLLAQYTITDNHLGALAWGEETLAGDYNLSIGEKLLLDWFAAAIKAAPDASRGVLAQLGDFLHYDGFKSVTQESGHLLDSDTRYPKIVRVAIRVLRRVITMLAEKHETVDVFMADANHDPAGGVWLREMFAAFLENEPRVRVNTAPGSYSFLEHGKTSLFYHHGHRRGVKNVDSAFVGKFREVYGRTEYSYAHLGHRHSDELLTTDLMKVEQHETLAAPDAYGANWLSGRSAKVIMYSDKFGEVGRVTMTPEMVVGASNDNQDAQVAA